jgi:hypothetical protein
MDEKGFGGGIGAQQLPSIKPADFGRTIEPKWQVTRRLVKEIEGAVEKEHLTPLDGAGPISAVAATLFGYDEFILREISRRRCSRQRQAGASSGRHWARGRGEGPFLSTPLCRQTRIKPCR